MTDDTKTALLCGAEAAALIGMLILSYFIRFLLPFFILPAAVLAAQLNIKTKYSLGLLLSLAAYAACTSTAFFMDGGGYPGALWYLLAPLFGFLSVGLSYSVRFRSIYKMVAVMALFASLGLLLMVMTACIVAGTDPAHAAETYVASSQSDYVYEKAKEDTVRTKMAMLEGEYTKEELQKQQKVIEEVVAKMPRAEVLASYAKNVRVDVGDNLFSYLYFLISFCSILGILGVVLLTRPFQKNLQGKAILTARKYEFGEIKNWALPRGYLLGTALPLLLLYLVGVSSEPVMAAYNALFRLLILVPFIADACALILYLFTRKRNVWAALAVPVIITSLIFLWGILLIIGIIDAMFNMRKIIGMMDHLEDL